MLNLAFAVAEVDRAFDALLLLVYQGKGTYDPTEAADLAAIYWDAVDRRNQLSALATETVQC
jgi:hypothetical protein